METIERNDQPLRFRALMTGLGVFVFIQLGAAAVMLLVAMHETG